MSDIECSVCIRAATWRESEQQWICPAGHGTTEQYAAANRLGQFALPFDPERDYERVAIPGFMQTGPTSYVRIAEPDAKQIYRDGIMAATAMAKRGEW